MGNARTLFLAAILSIWVTTEAFKPNSWIPEAIKKGGDLELIFPKDMNGSGLIMPRNANSSGLIFPKGGNNSGLIFPKENTIQSSLAIKMNGIFERLVTKTVKDCGAFTLNPGQTVTILSKNYPNNYPSNYKCIWKFQASASNSKVSISCPTFQLKGCRKSFLQIKGGSLKKKLCGRKHSVHEISTTNKMNIVFKTRRSKRTGKGFRCTVSASGTSPVTTQPPGPVTTRPTGPPSGCQSCGTVNRATRIVGGVATEVNEYPWQVALVYAGTNDVFCGGSIYNDRYIITAAHCGEAIENDNIDTEVLLEAHNLNNLSGVQRIAVTEIINHENYDSNTLDNDIALLKLARAATLNERAKPACLPNPSNAYTSINAIVSGWGTTTQGGNQPSTLREVEVPTMSNAKCRNSYGNDDITENMLCAGFAAGGKDSCQGDSGGPLAAYENGRWVLIGVVSWGYGCAQPDYPGVYARVTQYLSWLATKAASGQNNLCPTGSSTASPTGTTTKTTTTTTTTSAPSTGCKCGHVNTVNRIVGGNPTNVHEYPWQVALVDSDGRRPWCGGSIISDQWILTAGHCVPGMTSSNTKVVIGEHIWNSNSDTTATQRRTISQVIRHSGYNSNTLDNDIALIKLASPIVFSSDNKIAPICLPPEGNLYERVDATITGWGTTSSGGSQPYIMHEVTVPTMPNWECRQTDYGNDITSNMICAGLSAGGKDSCQGDSGGPMITAGNNAKSFMIQIGVVSWGYGCAERNRPGVYARVTNYLSWISSNTAGSTTCPST